MDKLKRRIINFIEKKCFEAGNLPEKYDKYSGGNDYAQLMDLEDIIKLLRMCGIEFSEKEESEL